jgi:CMP-N-acetylneuraminic acid synthetase
LKTLGVIPARGGSKGIPRKNVRPIAGKPLMAWTIEAALRSASLEVVVVSTDDEETAEEARRWGAQVPFLRPSALAQDDTPGVDPVLHALDHLPGFDSVLLMQPTSPLRSAEDIDACVALARTLDAVAVVSISEPGQHPYWMYRLGPDRKLQTLTDQPLTLRRQDLPPVYALNGALYFGRADWLRRHRTFITADTVGYVMPPERSLDVDTRHDWQVAELLLTEGR